MSEMSIPVVDFTCYSLLTREGDVDQTHLYKLAQEICEAFKNIGFVYLKNHGIDQHQIDDLNSKFQEFVSLPENKKELFSRQDNGHGWTPVAREGLNRQRPHDLKESYNFMTQYEGCVPSTNAVIPEFNDSLRKMFSTCNSLALRVLHAMGIGLKLQDPYYFCKRHNPDTEESLTCLRTLYYPAVKDTCEIQNNQLRCGEHSDWGSITLLFQDESGGLEVMSREGVFVPARPIPGTVLINIGDLMQRWTNDVLVSTVHKVCIPEMTSLTARQSMAFFFIPDNDCLVECLDGTNKYPSIRTKDYMQMKMKEAMLY